MGGDAKCKMQNVKCKMQNEVQTGPRSFCNLQFAICNLHSWSAPSPRAPSAPFRPSSFYPSSLPLFILPPSSFLLLAGLWLSPPAAPDQVGHAPLGAAQSPGRELQLRLRRPAAQPSHDAIAAGLQSDGGVGRAIRGSCSKTPGRSSTASPRPTRFMPWPSWPISAGRRCSTTERTRPATCTGRRCCTPIAICSTRVSRRAATLMIPQFRSACDVYNVRWRRRCGSKSQHHVCCPDRPPRSRPLGPWDITCRLRGGEWRPEEFDRFDFVSNYEIRGLKNQYQTLRAGRAADRRAARAMPASRRRHALLSAQAELSR